MSRMGKKALSLVLVLLVSISMLPAQIFADDGFLQTENTANGAGASEDWAGPEEKQRPAGDCLFRTGGNPNSGVDGGRFLL